MKIVPTISLLVLWTIVGTAAQVQQGDSASKSPGKAVREEPADITDKPVRMNVRLNQVGYLPRGAKYFVAEETTVTLLGTFSVINVDRQKNPCVFSGKLSRFVGDFGIYHVGDFSEVTAPGRYIIRVNFRRRKSCDDCFFSHIFRIAPDVYADALAKGINYFAVQRCGPSKTGYNTPCHLDDGRTKDGKPVDLVGGWHCASDLLKWPNFELAGMYALLSVAKLSDDKQLRARIYEEVQWGNLYCLKLQSPEGHFLSYGIGGDPVNQGNHWTDNKRGTVDDRPAVLNRGSLHLQHRFIAAEALLASLYGEGDRVYADKCLDAAKRCFGTLGEATDYLGLGTGISAGLRLYEATGSDKYKTYAVKMADGFLKLQQTEYAGDQKTVRGYFFRSNKREEGVCVSTTQPQAFISLCELAEVLPDHQEAPRWREGIKLHCRQYLGEISSRNAFGIVPCVAEPRKCKTRVAGKLGYRYFMCPEKYPSWVGNSANVAGAGVALLKAARILKQPELATLAQRQLDWIMGTNPFGLSFVVGVGHANPPEYVFTGFQPRPPFIPGAVMLGIGGDEADRPILQPGTYHTGEFSISRVYAFIWLLAEIQRSFPPDS